MANNMGGGSHGDGMQVTSDVLGAVGMAALQSTSDKTNQWNGT